MIALAAPIGLAGAGVLLLRRGWRAERWPVAAGWAAIVVATLWLAMAEGAWGIGVAALAAMLVACGLLVQAATASAPSRARAATERAPSVRLHVPGWQDVGRRVAVFLLSTPVAGLASGVLTLAIQAAMRQSGMVEADSTATALLLWPILWMLLTLVVLLETRVAAMLRWNLGVGVPGALAFWLLA